MFIITSEYKYYNIKLDETCNIVGKTLLKHEQKYTVGCLGMVKVECDADFSDKIENKIKIITIRSCNNKEELNEVLQSSEGMVILVETHKIMIVIERMVFENKSENHSR